MNQPQMDPRRPVRVIAVAGVDPGGGAGLLRDVLTGSALGVSVAAVGTAWTEQGVAGGVRRIEPRDPAAVRDALRWALGQHSGAAVKVGMVPSVSVADAILAALDEAGFSGPLVVDPVLFASSGGALWGAEPAALLPLLRRATIVTPNAGEAAALVGQPVTTLAQAAAAGAELRQQGMAAVLIKGGHLGADDQVITDTLVDPNGVQRFSWPRVSGRSPRGTGCALSTALAALLAEGASLPDAVDRAGHWLATRIAASVAVGAERHLP